MLDNCWKRFPHDALMDNYFHNLPLAANWLLIGTKLNC